MRTIEELEKEIKERETEFWEVHKDYGIIINNMAREWMEERDAMYKQISQQTKEIDRLRLSLIKQTSRTRLFLDILEPFLIKNEKVNNQ